jgi:alginate O-acetyltransferase complex protein AlgI
LNSVLALFPTVVRHAYVLLFLMISWLFFRADNLSDAMSYLAAMMGEGRGDGLIHHAGLYLNREVLVILAIAVVGSAPVMPWLKRRYLRNTLSRRARSGRRLSPTALAVATGYSFMLAALLLLSVSYMASGTYNPFIYFRF